MTLPIFLTNRIRSDYCLKNRFNNRDFFCRVWLDLSPIVITFKIPDKTSVLGIKSKLLFLGGEPASEEDQHPPWLLSLWKKIKHKTFDRGEVDEGKHICGATILLREFPQ